MGKIVERPILKRLKDKICFFFFKKDNYYLLRWIMLLAGFASISACSRVPWGLVSSKGGRYEWFYDKAGSSIWWAIFHCPLKRQWPQDPEWLATRMNICCQVCSESFVFVRPFRRGVALHLQSVSLYVWPWQGGLKRGGYIIISVKGLIVFCSHMKRVKMSPIIQPV